MMDNEILADISETIDKESETAWEQRADFLDAFYGPNTTPDGRVRRPQIPTHTILAELLAQQKRTNQLLHQLVLSLSNS